MRFAAGWIRARIRCFLRGASTLLCKVLFYIKAENKWTNFPCLISESSKRKLQLVHQSNTCQSGQVQNILNMYHYTKTLLAIPVMFKCSGIKRFNGKFRSLVVCPFVHIFTNSQFTTCSENYDIESKVDAIIEYGDGDVASLADLQQTFGRISWGHHARMVIAESKADYFKRRKTTSAAASTQVVLPADDELLRPQPSVIDMLFSEILDGIDRQNWDSVRDCVLKLQTHLKVVSGRESRTRGGWRYGSDFVLDTVLFADVLCRLQDDEDVLTKAVKLNHVMQIVRDTAVKLDC